MNLFNSGHESTSLTLLADNCNDQCGIGDCKNKSCEEALRFNMYMCLKHYNGACKGKRKVTKQDGTIKKLKKKILNSEKVATASRIILEKDLVFDTNGNELLMYCKEKTLKKYELHKSILVKELKIANEPIFLDDDESNAGLVNMALDAYGLPIYKGEVDRWKGLKNELNDTCINFWFHW